MRKLAQDIRIGDKIFTDVGYYIVSKYRWHFGIGVEVFDQAGNSRGTYPYKQEIEVSK